MKKDQIKKLVELANTLDEKGFSKVADGIDRVVEGQESLLGHPAINIVVSLLEQSIQTLRDSSRYQGEDGKAELLRVMEHLQGEIETSFGRAIVFLEKE